MKRYPNSHFSIITVILFCFLLIYNAACWAQDGEGESVLDKVAWQHGPSVAAVDDLAEVEVPEGYVFANGSDTRMLMEAMGNPASDQEVGFLAPSSLEWFVVFEFDKVGYIKDDDKDKLDADAILESLQKGAEESNKIRRERGYSGLNIVGWETPPQYNEVTHNLEWAVRAQDDNGELVLNHNTRVLGRRGVMRVTLVVAPQILAEVLPVYRANMDGFAFTPDQDYTAFVKGDKIAEYGLTALVAGGAGVAAAKFGLFKVLAKFGKIIFLGGLALLGAFWGRLKSLFSSKKETPTRVINDDTRETQSGKKAL